MGFTGLSFISAEHCVAVVVEAFLFFCFVVLGAKLSPFPCSRTPFYIRVAALLLCSRIFLLRLKLLRHNTCFATKILMISTQATAGRMVDQAAQEVFFCSRMRSGPDGPQVRTDTGGDLGVQTPCCPGKSAGVPICYMPLCDMPISNANMRCANTLCDMPICHYAICRHPI